MILAWTSASYQNDTALQKFDITSQLGQGLGVAVETMGLISFQKAYRQIIPGNNGTIQGVTYPLMMAVINVAHGKVTVRPRYSNATISLSCIHPYSV